MNVELQFASLAPGSIGAFFRTDTVEGVDPLTPVYVYNHERAGWEPRFRGKILCVSMFDLAIPPFMKATEYRVWNEDFLSKVTRGLKGGGIVTLVHRPEWEWHLGLAYSVFPLRPKNGTTTTRKPPKWWGADDLWCEVGDVRQLRAKIDAEQERLLGPRAAPGFARPQRPPAIVAAERLAHIQDGGLRMREALRLMGRDADDYERGRQQ